MTVVATLKGVSGCSKSVFFAKKLKLGADTGDDYVEDGEMMQEGDLAFLFTNLLRKKGLGHCHANK